MVKCVDCVFFPDFCDYYEQDGIDTCKDGLTEEENRLLVIKQTVS